MAGWIPTSSTSSFYLTVPSDISFASNKLNNFRVKLAEPIHLEGEWEVALTEIIYPVSNYNVHGGHFYMQTFPPHPTIFGHEQTAESLEPIIGGIIVPDNHYAGIHELISAIRDSYADYWKVRRLAVFERKVAKEDQQIKNDEMDRHNKALSAVHFFYSERKKRVKIKVDGVVGFIKLGPTLQYALGFKEATLEQGTHHADYPPDIKVGQKNMWIYTPLIEYQMVGSIMAPLLKVVPLRGKFGDQMVAEFVNEHFVGVLEKNFDSIEISIKDVSGKPIPFSFGGIIIKLHFRKKRYL